MISLTNITYSYNHKDTVLSIAKLTIKKEVTLIIGKNGSGKSTLANILANITKPTTGTISIDNINYTRKNNFLIRNKIGIVFADPNNQIIFNNVKSDLAFTLTNYKVPTSEQEKIIKDSLSKVNMLEYLNANPYTLSTGLKERLVLANTLAINPDYIVMDEATNFLDNNSKENIYKFIKNTNQGIIFITNNLNELFLADRLLILDNGKIINDLKSTAILNHLDDLKALGFTIPLYLQIIKELNLNINLKDYSATKLLEALK
jgi:energy-coupling factor transport system ATP-binding protein